MPQPLCEGCTEVSTNEGGLRHLQWWKTPLPVFRLFIARGLKLKCAGGHCSQRHLIGGPRRFKYNTKKKKKNGYSWKKQCFFVFGIYLYVSRQIKMFSSPNLFKLSSPVISLVFITMLAVFSRIITPEIVFLKKPFYFKWHWFFLWSILIIVGGKTTFFLKNTLKGRMTLLFWHQVADRKWPADQGYETPGLLYCK